MSDNEYPNEEVEGKDDILYSDEEYYEEYDDQEDDTKPRLLKVFGSKADKSHVISVSRAIVVSLSRHNCAILQAIGPPAVNNMIKAFIKAKSAVHDYSTDNILVNTCSFHRVNINGVITTAVRMKVFAVPAKVVA